MMKNFSTSKKSKLISLVLCIPYVCLWAILAFLISKGYSLGLFSVFQDAVGQWAVWLWMILFLLAFLSMIYLRCFIKKEWQVQLIAYLMTFIVAIACLECAKIANREFEEFSTEKWIQFPAQRITMYFDFEEKYDVEGFTQEEIINLLGEPDKIASNGTYIYEDTYGNAVYVKFENDRALYTHYVE